MSLEYLLTAFIICLSPGIGVVYTLSSTLGGGIRAGFWAATGCTIATVLHLVIAMAGLVLGTLSLSAMGLEVETALAASTTALCSCDIVAILGDSRRHAWISAWGIEQSFFF